MKVKVWDLPTRVFHWLLVLLFGVMWYTGKQGVFNIHILCGEAVAVLILFRLFWGFVGSDTARFSHFISGPRTIVRYLKGEISEAQQPGHNPLGALMVIALLIVLLAQVITGFFSADIDSFLDDGPLAHLIGEAAQSVTLVHKQLFNGLLVLVAVHLLAIMVYAFSHKPHLVRAMLTGKKNLSEPVLPLTFAPMCRALLCLLCALLLLWLMLILI